MRIPSVVAFFFFYTTCRAYIITTTPHTASTCFSSWNLTRIRSPDNRWNFAPKLMAEANRPDGFHVLSLGYVAPPLSYDTLFNNSNGTSLRLLLSLFTPPFFFMLRVYLRRLLTSRSRLRLAHRRHPRHGGRGRHEALPHLQRSGLSELFRVGALQYHSASRRYASSLDEHIQSQPLACAGAACESWHSGILVSFRLSTRNNSYHRKQ